LALFERDFCYFFASSRVRQENGTNGYFLINRHQEPSFPARMSQSRPIRNSEDTGSDFGRVLVVGDPGLCNHHIRAWKLAGVDARRISSFGKAIASNKNEKIYIDVCITNFTDRSAFIEDAIRSKSSIIIVEPVSDKCDTAKIHHKKHIRSSVSVLDPMKHHPLISRALQLISEGKIGPPRILKLEAKIYDRSLSDFSLFQGLLNGVSAARLLFRGTLVEKVFAKKLATEYSNFYVALLNFEKHSTCQLIVGDSKVEDKIDFSTTGPNGMISFDSSSESSDLPSNNSVEVMSKTFSDFLHQRDLGSIDLEKYRIAEAIQNSAQLKKQISL